jgi:hypothetical protein
MYFKEPAGGELKPLGTMLALTVGGACALILIGTGFGPWLLDWARTITWL